MDSTSWQVTRNIRLLTQKVLRLSSKHNPNALEQAKVFRPQMVGSCTVRKKAGIKLLARLEWLTIWVRAENKNLIVSLFFGLCHVDRSSNVKIGIKIWIFVYFFVFCCVKKETSFFNKISQPFLNLECAQNEFHRNIKSKTANNVRYSTPISTFIYLNYKRHDPHISPEMWVQVRIEHLQILKLMVWDFQGLHRCWTSGNR